MRAYHGSAISVDMKPGNEPVTEADRRASDLIVAGLASAFPDDIVISEENADDLRRLSAERVWYVDPIDGTKDFIRGHEGFSVMIGLTVEHRPVLGVVYQPIHQGLFSGAERGAWFRMPAKPPRRLQVARTDTPAELRLVSSRSNRPPEVDSVKSALGIRDEWNIGSIGLKLCLIALAERDLYVNPRSNSKAWDTCAPEAILAAAGGVMSDVHGQPLRYDSADLSRPQGLVASNGHAHDQVLARLKTLLSQSA